jgi:hypothetical protein
MYSRSHIKWPRSPGTTEYNCLGTREQVLTIQSNQGLSVGIEHSSSGTGNLPSRCFLGLATVASNTEIVNQRGKAEAGHADWGSKRLKGIIASAFGANGNKMKYGAKGLAHGKLS